MKAVKAGIIASIVALVFAGVAYAGSQVGIMQRDRTGDPSGPAGRLTQADDAVTFAAVQARTGAVARARARTCAGQQSGEPTRSRDRDRDGDCEGGGDRYGQYGEGPGGQNGDCSQTQDQAHEGAAWDDGDAGHEAGVAGPGQGECDGAGTGSGSGQGVGDGSCGGSGGGGGCDDQ